MKALVLACVVVWSSSAFAQPNKVEAENAYKLGQALYMREDYEGAAKQFKAAYDLDPDPVYLFNIAQALRLGKQCKESGDYYKRYLSEAQQAPNEEAVKAYIVEVDECAKSQQPAVVTPPVEPPKPEPPPARPIDPPRSNKRVVGYAVGGVGVLGVGIGFYFMSRVSDLEGQADAVCSNPCMQWDAAKAAKRASIDDKAHLREKLMVGSWIAGGAAIAAGVYLIVTGGKQTESSVAITPTRNGAMVSLAF